MDSPFNVFIIFIYEVVYSLYGVLYYNPSHDHSYVLLIKESWGFWWHCINYYHHSGQVYNCSLSWVSVAEHYCGGSLRQVVKPALTRDLHKGRCKMDTLQSVHSRNVYTMPPQSSWNIMHCSIRLIKCRRKLGVFH